MSEQPSRTSAPTGYVVVANAGAGSTELAAVSAAVARLAAEAPTQLVWTEEPEECTDLVRGLDEDRQLVIAGGDGSIHLTLGIVVDLDRTDRPVGIIPLGTGNDFARNHDLPLDPVEAADVVIARNVGDIDAMVLEATPAGGTPEKLMVANNMHVGLGVRAARTASNWKSALKRFAYPAATAYEGVQGETVELTVTVDGDQVWDGPLLAALVLLGPSMGGGIEMVPDQRRDLDVVLVEPADTDERASLVAAALRGRVYDADRAQHHHATTVTLAGRDGIEVNLDGEMLEFASPVTLTHAPKAWKVFVPAG